MNAECPGMEHSRDCSGHPMKVARPVPPWSWKIGTILRVSRCEATPPSGPLCPSVTEKASPGAHAVDEHATRNGWFLGLRRLFDASSRLLTAVFVVLAASAGCGVDYRIVDGCSEVGPYVACPLELPFDRARERCERMGADLVTVNGLEEQREIGRFGGFAVGPVWWSAGHEATPYACPVMDWHGASGPGDCSRLLPFVCERSP